MSCPSNNANCVIDQILAKRVLRTVFHDKNPYCVPNQVNMVVIWLLAHYVTNIHSDVNNIATASQIDLFNFWLRALEVLCHSLFDPIRNMYDNRQKWAPSPSDTTNLSLN